MTPLRILITNASLATRTGTETYVADLSRALLRAGHSPIVFSPILGDLALEVRRATIPVVDDLDQVGEAPDIIHGQHALETLSALTHFPQVPAVFFCHDSLSWRDVPPRFPRIRRYVAVDYNCLDRLVHEYGIPPERTAVLFNSVDLEAFPRRTPLPPAARRALVFASSAWENSWVAPVREACDRSGIALDVLGGGTPPDPRPGSRLAQYDLVFAKARAALEAMAVGNAVVLCDAAGLGGMVTSSELMRLRNLNFGMRTLVQPITAANVAAEIARYDKEDAGAVCQKIREIAGVDLLVAQIIELYREVLQEPDDSAAGSESRAISRYLRGLALRLERNSGAMASSLTIRWRNRLLRSRLLGIPIRYLVRKAGAYRWR